MGSGSSDAINTNIVKHISSCVEIPIMVGGGIKNQDNINRLVDSGATYLISGTMIEEMSHN